MTRRLRVAFVLAVAAVVPRAGAQAGGEGFLFHVPKGSFSVRAGYTVPRAGSDIFDHTTTLFTVDRRDFASFQGEMDLGFALNSRFQLTISTGYAQAKKRSEFREWEDNNGLPIEQTTKFSRIPLAIGGRYYLTGHGRSIGSFAWIPSRVSTFVGASGGMMWYEFEQTGDFVDFNDLGVFSHRYASSNTASLVDAYAGVDVTVSPRVALTAQAKYVHSDALMTSDWQGFDAIDLSGFGITAGLRFRY